LDFLKTNLDLHNLTLQDLKTPTAATVQTVYVRFLNEVGFNTESMLMPSMELLDSLDHPEIMKESIPKLNIQAGCSYLLQRLVGDDSFGIMDLLRPTAKRTQSFFSVFQNFWLFCNQRVSETEKVQEEVESRVKEKVKLESLIEEYKTRINMYRSKAEEDRANEEAIQEEIKILAKQLESFTPKREELEKEKHYLDGEMAKVTAKSEEIASKKCELQTEIDTLQGVFEGAKILEKLDQELTELTDSLEVKERRKMEFRNNLEVLDRTKEEYTAVLELVKQIAKEEEKAREIVGKIREQDGMLDSVKMEIDELEMQLRDIQIQIAEKESEFTKAKMQWTRRKAGKEEEIAEAKKAREEARLQLGEEQLVAVDLANQIRDLGLMEEEEIEQMGQEAAIIRGKYATLLESIEKFNEKINADYIKMDEAVAKMKTPPSL